MVTNNASPYSFELGFKTILRDVIFFIYNLYNLENRDFKNKVKF